MKIDKRLRGLVKCWKPLLYLTQGFLHKIPSIVHWSSQYRKKLEFVLAVLFSRRSCCRACCFLPILAVLASITVILHHRQITNTLDHDLHHRPCSSCQVASTRTNTPPPSSQHIKPLQSSKLFPCVPIRITTKSYLLSIYLVCCAPTSHLFRLMISISPTPSISSSFNTPSGKVAGSIAHHSPFQHS